MDRVQLKNVKMDGEQNILPECKTLLQNLCAIRTMFRAKFILYQ